MTTSNPEIVSVKDLEKRFGDFVAVDRVSFSIERGEIFGFLGPNGAGKSTTIRMLCGIITPSSGSGQVAGYDVVRQSESIKQTIGYMSQKFSLYEDLTPVENIRFYLGIYSVPESQWDERIGWALGQARLEEVKDRLTRELPPGWRQRLALACALLHRPEILFLDEPTSGVDPITRRHFWEFIREACPRRGHDLCDDPLHGRGPELRPDRHDQRGEGSSPSGAPARSLRRSARGRRRRR